MPRAPGLPPTASPGDDDHAPFLTRLRLQLVEVPERVEPTTFWGRTVLLVALALWSAKFIVNGIDWESIGGSFLHGANLAFHEFGHLFFRPFGEFMSILGGSLFQVLLPLALLAVFAVRQRDNFAAAVALWCGARISWTLRPTSATPNTACCRWWAAAARTATTGATCSRCSMPSTVVTRWRARASRSARW